MNERPLKVSAKKATTVAPPCVLVIFGVSGDLTKRLLMPAIFNLYNEGLLNPDFAILGINRGDPDEEKFRTELIQSVRETGPSMMLRHPSRRAAANQ
jgi:glucose-6-phosphate 1-dehydrogenase